MSLNEDNVLKLIDAVDELLVDITADLRPHPGEVITALSCVIAKVVEVSGADKNAAAEYASHCIKSMQFISAEESNLSAEELIDHITAKMLGKV